MVFLTRILGYIARNAHADKPLRRYQRTGFVDKLQIHVRGGTGGGGLPKYGGIGGNGGDVYMVATEKIHLGDVGKRARLTDVFAAGTGYDSRKSGIIGQPGEDLEIPVPVGTIAYDAKGNKIGEVNELNKKCVIAEGGVGGCEATGYGGLRGQNLKVILDLKLISDVTLVGFPNAGKSTFIRAVSNAKPRVADFPFTTVRPQLGVISYRDLRTITITDLPGLIEGAHENIGMGHDFLKHLERSKMLIFVVDVKGFRLSYKYTSRNCLETILLLNKEIELYNPALLDKPAMLVVNKMDLDEAETLFNRLKPTLENLEGHSSSFLNEFKPEKYLKFDEVIPFSLKDCRRHEIEDLKDRIRNMLDRVEEEEQERIDKEMPEFALVKKLKQKLRQRAPTLL